GLIYFCQAAKAVQSLLKILEPKICPEVELETDCLLLVQVSQKPFKVDFDSRSLLEDIEDMASGFRDFVTCEETRKPSGI
ncbi:unnamed protein product, partial [Dovyalis caffra]